MNYTPCMSDTYSKRGSHTRDGAAAFSILCADVRNLLIGELSAVSSWSFDLRGNNMAASLRSDLCGDFVALTSSRHAPHYAGDICLVHAEHLSNGFLRCFAIRIYASHIINLFVRKFSMGVLLAMRLNSAIITTLGYHVANIIQRQASKKVFGVTTWGKITAMEDVQFSWKFPIGTNVSKSMRLDGFTLQSWKAVFSISSRGSPSHPRPTGIGTTGFVNAAPERRSSLEKMTTRSLASAYDVISHSIALTQRLMVRSGLAVECLVGPLFIPQPKEG